jgi:hypothetical protein
MVSDNLGTTGDDIVEQLNFLENGISDVLGDKTREIILLTIDRYNNYRKSQYENKQCMTD